MSSTENLSPSEIAFQADKSLGQVTVALGVGSIFFFFTSMIQVLGALIVGNLTSNPELFERFFPTTIYGRFGGMITPQTVSLFYGFTGIIIFVASVLVGLACFFSRQRKHHVFVMAISALCTLQFPVGTGIGIFCLMNLNKKPVKALFETAKAPQVPSDQAGPPPIL